MKIYIVFKEGVYLQDVIGVFDDVALACQAMFAASSKEPDNYHHFFISTGELNQRFDIDNEVFSKFENRIEKFTVDEIVTDEFIEKLKEDIKK